MSENLVISRVALLARLRRVLSESEAKRVVADLTKTGTRTIDGHERARRASEGVVVDDVARRRARKAMGR